MMKRISLLIGIIVLLLGCSDVFAYFPPVYYPGTGHYYQAVSGKYDWQDAKAAAEAAGGYLATLTSAGEDSFVWNNVISGGNPSWYLLGGYQPEGSDEPAGGWSWVTGETWFYANWNDGVSPAEPNNTYVNENVVQYWNNGKWNDIIDDSDNSHYGGTTYYKGYILEYVPEPASMLLFGLGALGLGILKRKY